MLSQNLTFDILNKASAPLYCRLGEGEARRVIFAITSGGDNGPDTVYPNIENPVVTVRFLKPDSTFVYVTADLISTEEGIQEFAFTIPAEASQVSGIGRYDIRIQEDGEDNIVYSAEGMLIIDDDMITYDMIASVAAVNGLLFPDDFLTTESGAAVIDDTTTSEDSTWSSDKIAEEVASEIDNAITELIDDNVVSEDSTWSSDKIYDELSNIDTKHNYSTTEQVVGTWIDGRAVYEKTVDCGSMPVTSKTVPHGVSSPALIWMENGFFYDSQSGYSGAFNMASNTLGSQANIWVSSTDIEIWTGTDRTNCDKVYVTIRYVKTS